MAQPPPEQRVDGRWLQVGPGEPTVFEVAFPVVKVNQSTAGEPIKAAGAKATWVYRNTTWTLQAGGGLRVTWKSPNGQTLTWVREVTRSLENLSGEWIGTNGSSVTVTADGVVYMDGSRMLNQVQLDPDSGKLTWSDNRPKVWNVDEAASRPMRLVWKLADDEKRVVSWQRPLAKPELFPGGWHTSESVRNTEIFVDSDAHKVWRDGHLYAGELEFTDFGVFLTVTTEDPFALINFPKRRWELDMSKSSLAKAHWIPANRGVQDIAWFRCAVPRCLSTSIASTEVEVAAEPGYAIHVVPVADARWKEWQNKIVSNLHICKREFKHGGLTNSGVTKDHVKKLVEPNGVLDKYRSWMVITEVDEQVSAFALAHEIKGEQRAGDLALDPLFDVRRMYLDVICGSKDVPAPPGKKWGDIVLTRLEAVAREEGYPVLELGSLNAWLTEQYYSLRGYVELDHPCSGTAPERKPKYSIPENPQTVAEEKLNAYCAYYNIVANNERRARQLLEQKTWCGYRMTKDLTDELVNIRDPRSIGAVTSYGAKKKAATKAARKRGHEDVDLSNSPLPVGSKGGSAPKGGKTPYSGAKRPKTEDPVPHGYELRQR
jgi:hypothetical protein